MLTGMLDLLSMRDMHRVCTEYAERYGPIFKWRLFTFHVSSCICFLQAFSSSAVCVHCPRCLQITRSALAGVSLDAHPQLKGSSLL